MINNKNFNIKTVFRFGYLLFLFALLQGCQVSQIAQTNSATEIAKYKALVVKDLETYKHKLDLRNPYSYNPELSKRIIKEIKRGRDTINLSYDGTELSSENQYLHYAFLPRKIEHRSDYLILGLYKLIYKAYDLDSSHKVTALQYDADYMQELYKYLQVVRWKIRTNKGEDGQYLFLTWQNNWQVELMKHPSMDLNVIKNISYIKDKRETIYDPSNFSFEMLINRMLINVKYSLEEADIEPTEMSISALKTFIFII